MVAIVALAVVILIAALLGVAASKPNTFRVERETIIQAPPEKIFAQINDFHSWVAWSPWESLDSAMKKSYGGAASGKGAVYEWDGSMKVGQGRMEITDSTPPSKVTIKLDFLKPMEGHNIAEFTLEPRGDSTTVTWAMHGPVPFKAKLMRIFMSVDNMIGGQFETGLANLKTLVEK